MHELAITKSILRHSLLYAQEAKGDRITTIILRIGVLRDIEQEWLERYFAYISKGTIAEDAQIIIFHEPVICQCKICKQQFRINVEDYSTADVHCPECGVQNYDLISGTQFVIQAIEVHTTEE